MIAKVAPELERVGVRVLGADFYDPRPGAAVEFAAQSGWTFPQVFAADRRTFSDLHVLAPPQTIFVNSRGVVTFIQVGPFTDAQQFRKLAEKHLKVTLS